MNGEKSRYTHILFDLDGTLCDSVESMADCANHTMRDFGLREATIQDYKVFVGDGVDMLIKRCLLYTSCLPTRSVC